MTKEKSLNKWSIQWAVLFYGEAFIESTVAQLNRTLFYELPHPLLSNPIQSAYAHDFMLLNEIEIDVMNFLLDF